jgi:nucleotide-binding universal stress UspA family protein
MFKRILIAVDGSEAAGWALDAGVGLARSLSPTAPRAGRSADVRVGVVHVVDPYDTTNVVNTDLPDQRRDLPRALRRQGRQILHNAWERIPAEFSGQGRGRGEAAALGPCLLREGRAAEEIVATARDWHADLIVMGTHGPGRLAPLLVGGTADQTQRQAPCPVLVVGRPPREKGSSPLELGARLRPAAAVPA